MSGFRKLPAVAYVAGSDLVVGKLAGGMTVEQVAEEYGLEREDVLAALRYAAEAVAGEHVRPVR